MKIAIMQPYAYPYIGYFQLINAVDKFILLDDVNFINKGWINRNYILINNDKKLFTIPLEKASQNRKINEINTIDDDKWKKKFSKTIELAYKKSPFYNTIFNLIQKTIKYNESNIAAFNLHAIKKINEYLGISTEIVPTSTVYSNHHLKGDDRIINICKQESAKTYYNLIGGVDLYHKEKFSKNGIELNFLKLEYFKYKQYTEKYVPGLSIIDVMMFCDKKNMDNMLSKYQLI